jgi:hypothetical protein
VDTIRGTSEMGGKPHIAATVRLKKVLAMPIVLRIAQLSSK